MAWQRTAAGGIFRPAGARDSHKHVGSGDQPVGVEETKAGQQVAWGGVAKAGVGDAAHAHVEEGLPQRSSEGSAHPWTGSSCAARQSCPNSTHRDQDASSGGLPHDLGLGGRLLDGVCDFDQDHALQARRAGVRKAAMAMGTSPETYFFEDLEAGRAHEAVCEGHAAQADKDVPGGHGGRVRCDGAPGGAVVGVSALCGPADRHAQADCRLHSST